MSQDYELEVLARVRMRQHREAAQRLRNIAQAEQTACEQPKVPAGLSLAYLGCLITRFAAAGRLADIADPLRELWHRLRTTRPAPRRSSERMRPTELRTGPSPRR